MKGSESISHVLLDIEGTTCPVNFVSEVLFPYASQQLLSFLTEHQHEAAIQQLLNEISEALAVDSSPEATKLRAERAPSAETQGQRLQILSDYLGFLIKTDRKLAPLKDLQGRIWEEGYQRGELVAPLFADVPKALASWRGKGIGLSVYSSGSVHAQKLLYSHTEYGNLSHLFDHWFDTRTGPKNSSLSYTLIAESLQTKPESILFISDAIAELQAAKEAKMEVLFSKRPNNPQPEPNGFEAIEDFKQLDL